MDRLQMLSAALTGDNSKIFYMAHDFYWSPLSMRICNYLNVLVPKTVYRSFSGLFRLVIVP